MNEKPGASEKIKAILSDKGIKIVDFAVMYQTQPKKVKAKEGSDQKRMVSPQVVRNMLNRDNMTYATVKEMADILGCDIALVDRETGKIY